MSARDRQDLRIGISSTTTVTRSVVTQRPVERTAEYLDTFCRAASAATGVTATSVVADGFDVLVDGLRTGEIDVAWLSPVVALRAANVGRALPILLPVRQGAASFHSALFAREASPIRDVKDLSRARAAWVDKTSAAGYLVIRAALRSRGLGFEHAFADERFYGTHDAVAKAVLRGDADVGATYVHFRRGTNDVWRAGWGDARVQIVAKVGPIPADVIAASPSTPFERVRSLQSAMVSGTDMPLKAAASRLFEAEGFVEAESGHLEPLAKLLQFLEDAPRRWGSVPPPRPRR